MRSRVGLLLRSGRFLRRHRRLLQQLFERREDGVVLVVWNLEFPAVEARRKLLGLGGRLLGSGVRGDRDQRVRPVLATGDLDLQAIEGAIRRVRGGWVRRASALASVIERQ